MQAQIEREEEEMREKIEINRAIEEGAKIKRQEASKPKGVPLNPF
jgi:hypothetical protein